MNTSSEIDVICKQICREINSEGTASTIHGYFNEITSNYENFVSFEVNVPKFGLTLTPWIDWDVNKAPLWWSANNKVKHHRHSHFQEGNLKHLLNSFSALFVANLYLYKVEAEQSELSPNLKYFRASDERTNGTYVDGTDLFVTYEL
jgi:hypothetical protein